MPQTEPWRTFSNSGMGELLIQVLFQRKIAKQSVAISADIGGIRPNSGSRQMYLGELVPKISVSARDLNPEIKI